MAHTQRQTPANEEWPWNCSQCGTTIYHDDPTCRECDRTARAADLPPAGRSRGLIRAWVVWMRHQSYAGFVGKVGIIACLELLLTTLWLRVLFWGPIALADAIPG